MKRRWRWVVAALGLAIVLAVLYVRANPLVFSESMWEHEHCIKVALIELMDYCAENGGTYPSHPNGYGDALLLLDEQCYYALTGPGYDEAPFHRAKESGRDLPEQECGRVYVQGLTDKSHPDIALLFDKLPTPGGDHCHFPIRLWAPLGREVMFVGGDTSFVEEDDWPGFVKRQVELLVAEGFEREEVERLFAEKAKR